MSLCHPLLTLLHLSPQLIRASLLSTCLSFQFFMLRKHYSPTFPRSVLILDYTICSTLQCKFLIWKFTSKLLKASVFYLFFIIILIIMSLNNLSLLYCSLCVNIYSDLLHDWKNIPSIYSVHTFVVIYLSRCLCLQ